MVFNGYVFCFLFFFFELDGRSLINLFVYVNGFFVLMFNRCYMLWVFYDQYELDDNWLKWNYLFIFEVFLVVYIRLVKLFFEDFSILLEIIYLSFLNVEIIDFKWLILLQLFYIEVLQMEIFYIESGDN